MAFLRCVHASLYEALYVCPSVGLSVGPSVGLLVGPLVGPLVGLLNRNAVEIFADKLSNTHYCPRPPVTSNAVVYTPL